MESKVRTFSFLFLRQKWAFKNHSHNQKDTKYLFKGDTSDIFTVSGRSTMGDFTPYHYWSWRWGEGRAQARQSWRKAEWSRGFRERWSKGNEYCLWGCSPRDHAIKTTGPNYTVPHREWTPLSFLRYRSSSISCTFFLWSVYHTPTYTQRTPHLALTSSHESSSNTAQRKIHL